MIAGCGASERGPGWLLRPAPLRLGARRPGRWDQGQLGTGCVQVLPRLSPPAGPLPGTATLPLASSQCNGTRFERLHASSECRIFLRVSLSHCPLPFPACWIWGARRGSPSRLGGGCCRALDSYQTHLQTGERGLPDAGALPNAGSARQHAAGSATEGRGKEVCSGLGTCGGPGPHLQSPGETWGQITRETTSNAVTEGTANMDAFRMSKSPLKTNATAPRPGRRHGVRTHPHGGDRPLRTEPPAPRPYEAASWSGVCSETFNEVLSVHRTSLTFTAAGEGLQGQRGNQNSQGM